MTTEETAKVQDILRVIYPKCSVVKARAWYSDQTFGYDRWLADEYSLGKGTNDCLIVVIPNQETLPES